MHMYIHTDWPFLRKKICIEHIMHDKEEGSREGGDIGLFISLVPKVLNNVLLFVGSTTLGAFIEF